MKKLLLALALTAYANPGHAERKTDAAWGRLASQGPFAFLGVVEKASASTVSTLPANDANTVVKVEKVFRSPVSGLAGQLITVTLAKGAPLKAGARALFFAAPGLFGKSIVLREVGHVANVANGDALAAQVDAAYRAAADLGLQARLAHASLVLSGRVVHAGSRPGQEKLYPASEHDPLWQVAEVAVETVEKGNLGTKTVSIYFPGSNDIRWFAAPRYTSGKAGIWILRNEPPKEKETQPPPGLTALDPQDFLPIDQLARVRGLLKGGR